MFLSLFRCTVCALCAVACFGGTEEWNWNFVEKYGGRMLSVEPPIAVLENFLTRDELEHLKNAGSSFLKPAETAITIVNTDHLHIELNIFEKDLSKLTEGNSKIEAVFLAVSDYCLTQTQE